MMLFLAVRHLLSRKRQTLLILFGISLGTMVYVGIAGIQLGFRQLIVDKLINNNAHVKISGREEPITPTAIRAIFYPKSDVVIDWVAPPSGKRDEARILYPQGWFGVLDRSPDVMAYAPLFVSQAILARGAIRGTAQIQGINVERQLQVTDLAKDMKEGRIENLGRGGSRIVLGSKLAEKLGARMDESVFVSTGTGRSRPFKVVGLYESGVHQLDETIAYASILDVQQLAGTPGRVTTIAVKLNDVEQAASLAEQWSIAGADKVESWEQSNASILQVFQIQDIVRAFITSTVFIVAAFGIYNVLSIIINQKKREIAILRALGFAPREIERLFLLQGLLLGISGSAVGLGLGFVLCYGISMVRLQNMNMSSLPISFAPSIYLWGLAIAMVSSVAAGFFPARAARRMTPIDIIRSEA